MVPSGVTKKSPVTPPGIDPENLGLVAQCLNHYKKAYMHKIKFKEKRGYPFAEILFGKYITILSEDLDI
jgi:hypothetical protein